MTTVYTVSALTTQLKNSLEERFPFVWVKGEVSNIARPSSGHVYFTLKDKDALLQCVWFKTYQQRHEKFDPMTGEVFTDGPRPSLAQSLKNGAHLLCAGHVSVYGQRGVYQLVVALGHEEGKSGALHAAFEALKAKLYDEGFFAPQRKRPLPQHPQKVAVLTAPTGAAIQDFVRIAESRGLASHIRIYPVPVQGDAAAPAIVQAMGEAGTWGDLIVLIRGGGSLEDLWAFNEEAVARAIFASPIPVLAGIGHEVDVTIADMTADVRAATPTHAAHILWIERQELMQWVDSYDMALYDAITHRIKHYEEVLTMHEKALQWLSPLHLWQRHSEMLKHYTSRLAMCSQRIGVDAHTQLTFIQKALQTAVQTHIDKQSTQLMRHEKTLTESTEQYFEHYTRCLEHNTLRLDVCDPLAPLQRGYALVHTAEGHVVSSVDTLTEGQRLHLSLADGVALADVHSTQKNVQ